ncbi:MAG: DUF4124 domain-containing protein [Gammaproteobacteria bacterium]|nr:DUF4124 domain-containing protein [Gammaproteobacteria bacterium]
MLELTGVRRSMPRLIPSERKSRSARPVAGLLASLLIALPAHAEIYKWVDKDGNTTYSTSPPPGQHADIVKPKVSRPADATPRTPKATDGKKTPPKPKDSAPLLTPEMQKELRAACDKAHTVLKQLSVSNRARYINDKKELVYATDAERQARIKEANQKIKDYCK